MIASKIYKRISYQIWQYIHIITYILVFGVLIHAIKWGSDVDDFVFLYIVITIGLIIGIVYRTQYKIRRLYSGKFIVKSIKEETKDTFTIIVIPEKAFKFKAGQFCFLRLNKNKLYARHPFTISSAPYEKEISFTIKLAGRFTETAKELKAGDEILVDGPFGKFIPKIGMNNIETDIAVKDLVFIAGGVGIAPFMSILKDIQKNKENKQKIPNIILFYGSQTEEDIIFRKELDAINEGWFKKVYILDNGEKSNTLFEYGYITKDIIKKYVRNINNSLYYICGPEIMKDSTKKILAELGVKNKNILIEDFFW